MSAATTLLAAALIAVVLAGSGARLRRVLRLPAAPAVRLPVELALGSWLVALALLGLGIAGMLRPVPVLAVLGVLGVLGRYRRPRRPSGPATLALLGALAALPVALARPFFYDALVYHLGLPWQALRDGRLAAQPESVFGAFPPLAQLVYAVPLVIGLERVPALLHLIAFTAAALALVALSRSLGAPRWAAGLTAAAFLVAPGHAAVPGLPAAEGWAVLGVLAALAVAGVRRMPPGAGLLAGLLVGIAGAARLQGLVWGAIVLALVAARTRRARVGAAVVAGWLAGSAPWWLKNLVLLGAPLAPLGWTGEGMATLWRDAGTAIGLDAPALLGRLPADLAPHLGYGAPLLLAAALAVRRGRAALLAGALVVSLVAWQLTGPLPRFLAPTVALLLALAATAAGRGPAGRLAAALALGGTLALGAAFTGSELVRLGGGRVLGILEPTARGRWVPNDPAPAFAAATALPADARALFVGEPRGFGFPRRFVAPSQHDPSPLRALLGREVSPAETCRALDRAGFTHLLVNWRELERLAPAYPAAPWPDEAGRRRWQLLLAALGRPVLEVSGVTVHAIEHCARPVAGVPGV